MVTRRITREPAKLNFREEYELRYEDYIGEMPRSGERIREWENMRAMQEAYPNPPSRSRREQRVGRMEAGRARTLTTGRTGRATKEMQI